MFFGSSQRAPVRVLTKCMPRGTSTGPLLATRRGSLVDERLRETLLQAELPSARMTTRYQRLRMMNSLRILEHSPRVPWIGVRKA
jgi:hypothetical protein